MRRAEVDRWGAEREEAKRTGVDIERIKLKEGKKEGRVIVGKIDQGYKCGGRKKRYLSILCPTTPTPGLFPRKRPAINTAPQPSEAQQWLHPLHRKAASQKQKTKEKTSAKGKKKHWKKLPVYKKSHLHSNPG